MEVDESSLVRGDVPLPRQSNDTRNNRLLVHPSTWALAWHLGFGSGSGDARRDDDQARRIHDAIRPGEELQSYDSPMNDSSKYSLDSLVIPPTKIAA